METSKHSLFKRIYRIWLFAIAFQTASISSQAQDPTFQGNGYEFSRDQPNDLYYDIDSSSYEQVNTNYPQQWQDAFQSQANSQGYFNQESGVQYYPEASDYKPAPYFQVDQENSSSHSMQQIQKGDEDGFKYTVETSRATVPLPASAPLSQKECNWQDNFIDYHFSEPASFSSFSSPAADTSNFSNPNFSTPLNSPQTPIHSEPFPSPFPTPISGADKENYTDFDFKPNKTVIVPPPSPPTVSEKNQDSSNESNEYDDAGEFEIDDFEDAEEAKSSLIEKKSSENESKKEEIEKHEKEKKKDLGTAEKIETSINKEAYGQDGKESNEQLKKIAQQLSSSFKITGKEEEKKETEEDKEEVVAQQVVPGSRSPYQIPSNQNAAAPPRPPTIVTPDAPSDLPNASKDSGRALSEISINFNNVAMIEYIRFMSRISNRNFIFDDQDLQFNVTIVSEEPTTVDNLMAALLQELRIRDLSLIEQGNNIIIHRNPRVRSPARIVADDAGGMVNSRESELVTRVFRLNTLDPVKASEIIRPLLSDDALIEVLKDTNNLIITDLVTNINKISQLIGSLDSPNSGITIGQYVVRNAFVDSLVDLANKILQPIAQGNPFVLVPHSVSNSIFIVSNSFIVEKALAILQNLDINEGRTKILSLETLQPAYVQSDRDRGSISRDQIPQARPGQPFEPSTQAFPFRPAAGIPAAPAGGQPLVGPGGQLIIPEGMPESFPIGGIGTEGRNLPLLPSPAAPLTVAGPIPGVPLGAPELSIPGSQGGLYTESPFVTGEIGSDEGTAIFDESRNFLPGGISAATRWSRDLPVGHIERTLFFIYKLRYRKGDSIEIALRKIAASLAMAGTANADLISTINSIQWIESSNALIFTGTSRALGKIKELIMEIDVPLRQVFIEMLILDTSVVDSLNYSVDWINRFGGGTTTGEEGFTGVQRNLDPSVNQFIRRGEAIFPNGRVECPLPQPACPLPVATGFLNSAGFVAGIIGTHLTHNGTQFNSLGALVQAIHTDAKTNIILNPKIITEDNSPAEIFVGGTDRYKAQSITNDLGDLVTNNFQFIDVGTTLRVTPLIGNNGIITLEIIQETTDNAPGANNPTLATNQNVNLVRVLSKARTVTKVHVPNGFFVILSGMIHDRETRGYSRIPCLGGIPIIGSIGKKQTTSDDKRNLMLFIRPLIIDTEDEFEDITKRQQDVFREKSKFRRAWNYEIDEGLDFLNIKYVDPDESNCIVR